MSNHAHHQSAGYWVLGLGILLALTSPSIGEAQPAATLDWNANTETDLGGYEIFRSLTPCPSDPAGPGLSAVTRVGKVTTWKDPALPATATVVCYGIKAFDTSNNISPMSNLVSKSFTRPAPTLLGHWTQKTDVPHAANQNLKTYTIHALVNPKAPMTVFSPALVKNYTYFLYSAVKGYCGDGALMAGHTASGTVQRVCVAQPLEPGQWTAVTSTYDGTTLTVYRNRVAVGSAAMPPPNDSTGSMQIGGSKYNETCNCDQEVWLYDQAMTATEVAALPKAPTTAPVIKVTPTTLTFTGSVGQPDPAAQVVAVTNAGTGTLTWTATSDQSWLTVTPEAAQVHVAVRRGTLVPGSYIGTITISSPGLTSATVTVTYTVKADTIPPQAPGPLRLVDRPTAGTATLAWSQSGQPPTQYRIDRFVGTGWRELMRVPGTMLSVQAPLADVGRRQFRVCSVLSASVLCNDREGVWVAR